MIFYLLLITCLCRSYTLAIRASESDRGRLTLKTDEMGSNIYFSDDLAMTDKIHFVLSVPVCKCVGMVDVQKINQLDYMIATENLFSYAVYVNDGKYIDRLPCSLSKAHIQDRTDLRINVIGSYQDENINVWAPVDKPNFDERIEGIVMASAIEDFLAHTYVVANANKIFTADHYGGILMSQGNVMMRPCNLFPWFMPWIFDEYDSDALVDIIIQDGTAVNHTSAAWHYSSEYMALFNSVVLGLRNTNTITSKHLFNLKDNAKSTTQFTAFAFQAIFIPHRYAAEFRLLIDPFTKTHLSPYLYVPYVMQLMFDRYEWLHFRGSDYNETIKIGPSLLTSCAGATVDDTELNVDYEAASLLYWFASSWCGTGVFVDVQHYIDVQYQYIVQFQKITGIGVYGILFFVLLSLCICCGLCYFRVRLIRAIAKTKAYYASGYRMVILKDEDDEGHNDL